jgi:hypothetical protein
VIVGHNSLRHIAGCDVAVAAYELSDVIGVRILQAASSHVPRHEEVRAPILVTANQ